MKTLRDYIYGLGVLDQSNPYVRVLRRAAVMGLITFFATVIVGYQNMVNPVYLPLLVALGAGVDKSLRELL